MKSGWEAKMRLIDADALKKAIAQNRGIDSDTVCDVLDIIDNAPTVETHDTVNMYCDKDTQIIVEQIRPKGHWIREDALRCLYYCSECRNNGEHVQPFCAWCGADMRKGGTE